MHSSSIPTSAWQLTELRALTAVFTLKIARLQQFRNCYKPKARTQMAFHRRGPRRRRVPSGWVAGVEEEATFHYAQRVYVHSETALRRDEMQLRITRLLIAATVFVTIAAHSQTNPAPAASSPANKWPAKDGTIVLSNF